MKILLIATNISESPYPVYPLGISVLSNALSQKGHKVKQMDYLFKDKDTKLICAEIDKFKPEIIGISIRNIDNTNLTNVKDYTNTAIELISEIKKQYNIPIVLGGSGYSLFPSVLLEKTKADFGFVGESENTFTRFIENYINGILPERKIIYPDISADHTISPALYSKEILDFYLKYGGIAPIQTKRGCQNSCIYCTYPKLEGRKIHIREPKDVVKDIQTLKNEFGAKMIFFTDSVFNDKNKYFMDVINEMLKQKINIPWTAFFQPGNITEKDVDMMKQTGLEYLELGADASTDVTLSKLGKKFKFKDITDTVKLFNQSGIYSSVYFMFGGPGETESTVLEGIENIKSIGHAISIIFMGIRILPGTGLEKVAIREGLISKEDNLFLDSYYISPDLDKEWLNRTLTESFKGIKHCIFPPDSLDKKLKLLHSIGCTGMGLDKILI